MPALWIHVASFTQGNSVRFLSFRNPSEGAVNHRHPLPCTRRMAADKAPFSAARRTLFAPLHWMYHPVGLSFVPKQTENGAQLRSWITLATRDHSTLFVNLQELKPYKLNRTGLANYLLPDKTTIKCSLILIVALWLFSVKKIYICRLDLHYTGRNKSASKTCLIRCIK